MIKSYKIRYVSLNDNILNVLFKITLDYLSIELELFYCMCFSESFSFLNYLFLKCLTKSCVDITDVLLYCIICVYFKISSFFINKKIFYTEVKSVMAWRLWNMIKSWAMV